MTKGELADAVAADEDAGLTRAEAVRAVKAVFEAIEEELVKGGKVSLAGFGNFEVRHRSARTGRNPQTGAAVQIAASKAPAFKAAKRLKEAVNN